MKNNTEQEKIWLGDFGKNYTERNIYSPLELDRFYQNTYGITRSAMNENFLNVFEKDIKILEVGSNVGNQLLFLQEMGFKNLYGIELQNYAVEISKSRTKNINILQGSAFDIPFKDNYFDLVFTSGVLIHINPKDLPKVLKEIYRCSKKYIWGFEYFSENFSEINYRGNNNLLWKGNYPVIYQEFFPNLKLIKEEKYKYLNSENVDQMFLLEDQ